MKRLKGNPLPIGILIKEGGVNFSIVAEKGKECSLLLYRVGSTKPAYTFEMKEEDAIGNVRFLEVQGIDIKKYEYNYLIDGEIVTDNCAKAVAGKEIWGKEADRSAHEIRGRFVSSDYDWEDDEWLKIPYEDVVAYELHVRGFTRHSSSKVKKKGTFAGVIEKIPYLKELGINQIHCMPVYEFEECLEDKVNYWGYGPAFYFAPKASYSSSKDPVNELKDMVKACHKAGIEVILEMAFEYGYSVHMMNECLRYYMLEYHVDGFIVNPAVLSPEDVRKDALLKDIKIMKYQDTFQAVMRRFLKGDEGMVGEVIGRLKQVSFQDGVFNYMTSHNGFTLCDLVSYDRKHNEENGERNEDGPDYNFSWNCGVEGPSRKKSIVQMREKQMRNAFVFLLLAQGTPCILAGDEFGNSQNGNNNAYCQDNATGWLDWRKLEKEQELFSFVKNLIAFRKKYKVFHPSDEFLGIDRTSCGLPDVSYHGESAWHVPDEYVSRQLGVFYCKEEKLFVAYNMHWEEHTFGLPSLAKEEHWRQLLSTQDGMFEETPLESERGVKVGARAVAVLMAVKE